MAIILQTDKGVYLDPFEIQKLDLICKRCTKANFDNLIIVEGAEGYGKSTKVFSSAYYCAWKTGREYNVNHVFFDAEEMMKFAINTQDQIIHWDEAAFGGLGMDWQKRINKLLIRMLMVARKKRHIYFVCVPKFFKLNEYIIDRAIGMIRVYAKEEIKLGNYVWFTKAGVQACLNEWKRTKKVWYKKHFSFAGKFYKVGVDKIIDLEEYERKKDEAIKNLLKEEKRGAEFAHLTKLKYRVYIATKKLTKNFKKEGITMDYLARLLNLDRPTLSSWGSLKKKFPELLESEKEEED